MREVRADVAVVGASLAGCTAARLFAQQGLAVALIERNSDRAAYKRLCGHFIQPSAIGVLQRLGLAQLIEEAGGVRAEIDLWTRWGTIPHHVDAEPSSHGYAIRRSRLDPMLRELTISTPGVSYLGGYSAAALPHDGGVVATGAEGEVLVRARLVVGADGRNSTVARLAAAPTRTLPNARFCYMAYFTGIDLGLGPTVTARLWSRDGDAAIASRNEDGVTILALFLDKARLDSFRRNRDAAFLDVWRSLPDGPQMTGEQISSLVGYVDYPVQMRPSVPRPGIVLIGDAAHSADPLWAIGCGWAFQTAEWLAEAVSPALKGKGSLARSLQAYERVRRAHIGGHQRFLALAAGSAKPNPIQKLMFSAAVRDRRTARLLHAFAAREIPVRRFLSPSALSRAALVNLAGLLGSRATIRSP